MKFLRLSLIPLLLYSTIIAKSENITVKIYFDKNWMVCDKDRALFYRQAGWDTIKNCYDGKFIDFLISEVKISEGQYEKGRKKGAFNFYNETGLLETKAFFKEDKPDSTWSWFFPNGKLHFQIIFNNDLFEITTLNDESGKSIIENTSEFFFPFQNDSINKMDIKGTIKGKKKDGNWSIIFKGNIISNDIYREGKYLKSTLLNGTPTTSKTKIINNQMFIPYSIYACEKLILKQTITDADYPFLSFRFPWQPIDAAVGLIGDSLLFQIDKKPMYVGGMEAINQTIGRNTNITSEAVQSEKNWGWVYYDIIIDEKGFIVDKRITKSPDNLLNDIALSSLNSLGQFRPAFHNGHPVKSKISSRIQFVKRTTFPSRAFGNH